MALALHKNSTGVPTGIPPEIGRMLKGAMKRQHYDTGTDMDVDD